MMYDMQSPGSGELVLVNIHYPREENGHIRRRPLLLVLALALFVPGWHDSS